MRLRREPKTIQIDGQLSALERFCARQEALSAVYLFGSYGTEHQTPLSDVDIAVLVKRAHHPMSLKDRLTLEDQISRILREDDVNLLILNDAPVVFRHKVLKQGRMLYRAGHGTDLADFIEGTLNVYLDFIASYRAFLRDYDRARLEEARHGR